MCIVGCLMWRESPGMAALTFILKGRWASAPDVVLRVIVQQMVTSCDSLSSEVEGGNDSSPLPDSVTHGEVFKCRSQVNDGWNWNTLSVMAPVHVGSSWKCCHRFLSRVWRCKPSKEFASSQCLVVPFTAAEHENNEAEYLQRKMSKRAKSGRSHWCMKVNAINAPLWPTYMF